MIKFIVIDDEPYVADLFPKLLDWQEQGFELMHTFSSAADALAWLAENECNVVFTDINMPDMSGSELARICRLEYPNVVIVFFSAYSDFKYAYDAIKNNVFDYILKPISSAELKETVGRLSDKFSSIPEELFVIGDQPTENENNAITAAKQFIMDHYNEDIYVSDIAKHINLSNGYFSALYKKMTNETAVSTLRNYRLAKAKELLENKHIKLSSIPKLVGFKSYSYFTKIFQSAYGETPTDYRARILGSKKGD